MSTAEIWSALGLPARTAARFLLVPRYFVNGFPHLRTWHQNVYARTRYGPSYRWRIWLLFDAEDLEELEHLINQGSDREVLEMREAKLEQFRLVALVGALLSTLALQALSLPYLTDATFVARSCFVLSTTLSLLATFFTCIQQRELGVIRTASALRIWMSNGTQYRNQQGSLVWQSSLASLTLLEAPYELLYLAVSNFVVGISVYMVSMWKDQLPVQKETGGLEGMAVLIYFSIGTMFAFTLFPVLLGSKDVEWKIGTMEASEPHVETLSQNQDGIWLESRTGMESKRASGVGVTALQQSW